MLRLHQVSAITLHIVPGHVVQVKVVGENGVDSHSVQAEARVPPLRPRKALVFQCLRLSRDCEPRHGALIGLMPAVEVALVLTTKSLLLHCGPRDDSWVLIGSHGRADRPDLSVADTEEANFVKRNDGEVLALFLTQVKLVIPRLWRAQNLIVASVIGIDHTEFLIS